MDRKYWFKQTTDGPLFPDLLWSRPENKRAAGKLLIIGGNAHGFAAPAAAFAAAGAAGAGTVRVLLPDSLQKTVGRAFPAGEFAPSTPSGSFSRQALGEFLEVADWADAVLLAGDLGHNSETAALLEKFVQDYKGRLVLAQDALDYFTGGSGTIFERPDTLLAASFGQLQKLARAASFPQAFTSNMDLLRFIDNAHDFTDRYAASLIVEHFGNLAAAVNGQVSTTKTGKAPDISATGAYAAVWWLQNPSKPFEACSSAIIEVIR
ncbi:MAG TPA: hypothetical protein VM535_01235 [Candidatus Saccharimonadales bacterium]|nr:hypothetical protein [Candidatus Saccharimonadales bacterium]